MRPSIESVRLRCGHLIVEQQGQAVYFKRPVPPAGIHDDRERFCLFVREIDAAIEMLQTIKANHAA